MPNSRDKGDDAAAELAGLIIGAILAFGIGLFMGKRAAKAREKTIEFSDTLEIDPDIDYRIHRSPKRTYVSQKAVYSSPQSERIAYLVFAGLASMFACVALLVAPASLVSPTGTDVLRLIFVGGGLFGFMVFGFLTGWLFVRASRVDPIPRLIRPPREVEAQANAKVKPLNLDQARVYSITLPKTTEWQPQTAGRFMQDILVKLGGRLTFQIVAEKGHIIWRIVDLRQLVDPLIVKQAIHAFYPDAEITEGRFSFSDLKTPFYRYITAFCQEANFILPILKVEELNQFDPLVNITQEMSVLEPGEQIVYTLFVADCAKFVYDQAEYLLTTKLPAFNLVEKGFDIGSGGRWENRYEPSTQKLVEEKMQNVVYQCLLLVEVNTPNSQRLEVINHLQSHLLQYKSFNLLSALPIDLWNTTNYIDSASKHGVTSTIGVLGASLINVKTNWQDFRLLLDTRELAALWHLPHQGFTAPNIAWSHGKQVQMPAVMKGNREGICLGLNRYAGRDELVYMPLDDRTTHTAIVGRTGTGKSTLLHNLIHQDILRNRGVAVIDPHGALVRDVLRWSIPPTRERDVVVIDLANEEYPPPLNLLAIPKGLTRENAAGQVMAILEKFGSFDDTVTVAPALWACLMTLWQEETPTLRDVPRLFEDATYRNRLLNKLENAAAEDFWDKYEAKSRGQQELLSSPVAHRIGTFYGNSFLYPMMCHPDTVDFSSLIRQNKIVLVSLKMDENRLPPHDQRLLGATLLSQIQMAAMAGAVKYPPYHLYIDEVQHFITSSLAEMFSEARKDGLSLTLANQYLKQLTGDTLEAVIGNVGALIAFQCGLDDAKALAPYMKPGFEANDLLNMDKYNAAVYMRYNGHTQPAFGIVTRPAPGEDRGLYQEHPEERERRIRALSVRQYTPMNRQAVMEWLRERYPRRRRTATGNTDDSFSDPI